MMTLLAGVVVLAVGVPLNAMTTRLMPRSEGGDWMILFDGQVSSNEAAHCGFPTAAPLQDNCYVAFRAATGHTVQDGRTIVVSSQNGTNWTQRFAPATPFPGYTDAEACSISSDGSTLYLFVTWFTNTGYSTCRTALYSSTDGTSWTTNVTGLNNLYVMHSLATNGTNIITSYSLNSATTFCHVATSNFSAWTTNTVAGGAGCTNNEAGIWFDGTNLCMLMRREDTEWLHDYAQTAYPFTNWIVSAGRGIRVDAPCIQPCGAFGRVLVTRDHVRERFATAVYSVYSGGRLYPRLHLTRYISDTGYGASVTMGDKLWCVYYTGSVTAAVVRCAVVSAP